MLRSFLNLLLRVWEALLSSLDSSRDGSSNLKGPARRRKKGAVELALDDVEYLISVVFDDEKLRFLSGLQHFSTIFPIPSLPLYKSVELDKLTLPYTSLTLSGCNCEV